MVENLAAGDEIELDENRPEGYRLLKRGGNVCVQVIRTEGLTECQTRLSELVESLGGWCDGATPQLLVFTIPVGVGFANIEKTFHECESICPGATWMYNNVYDASGRPLGWWADDR
jgi:hypothetical protein